MSESVHPVKLCTGIESAFNQTKNGVDMKTFLKNLWRILLISIFIFGSPGFSALPGAAAPAATPLVDGVVDAVYGAPVAIDSSGDGNSSAVMDLLELYVTDDASYVYFAFTINADIGATDWGKYILYLDTDGIPGSGATSDAWGRNVAAASEHLPEFSINTWVDSAPYGTDDIQFWGWSGAAWSSLGAISEAALGAGTTSVIEWKVAKTDLGSPNGFWAEVYSTGGGGGDNAQDTINFPADDWNASDWSTQALLSVSSPYIAVDGGHDASYGEAAATDPLGDMTESNLDLQRLFITEDASTYFVALDAYAGTYGMGYGIYIDTDQVSGSGGTSDPWGRNINAVSEHLPEYALYVWHMDTDAIENAQLTTWNGSGWDYPTLISLGGEQGYSGANDWLEYGIPKSALGSPAKIALEAFTIPGCCHAQDTVPSDPNVAYTAPDYSGDVTTLSAFYLFPPSAILLDVSSPADGAKFASPEIEVIGQVTPAVGVTVEIDLNGTDQFTPALDVDGNFNQLVTLASGSNTLTVSATDGVDTTTVVRTVTFGAGVDNDVWWDYLGHDSRDLLYRVPGGPQTTGVEVTLRFTAARNDLTGARVRVWNDLLNQQSFYDMEVAASDSIYDYWEVTLPASVDPTVYWYRFLAIDGTRTVYYEDDAARDGGWGEPFDTSPDNSWQLTFSDPAFQTPAWVKNAVIYQVFTDRFRDGVSGNNTPTGSFFYDEAGGTIFRSNTSDWNTAICDPRDALDCPGTWSKNFYGGDLVGVTAKLDYLADLGVTAIYFNPLFESPSNHKYDATDFSVIDDNFGTMGEFNNLVSEANARGIAIILDGVFNHTSSDSIFFDRYGRYTEVGACESPSSTYRSWYYFTDVTPGTGVCVGSDGTPNAAVYTSWFGFDSLPKLNSSNPAVRSYIYASGPSAIGRYWLDRGADGWRLDVGGDVDPGQLSDPTNDYWEEFRQALYLSNPQAYIVGEEWNYATSWLLGSEWDATMNYQFSSAILSFWRDTPFTDNDHNAGSSAGPLNPLTVSELNDRLLNLQERYPEEAIYAMMNLLGSHDTNRPLFMLDHNAASGTDDTLLDDPNYDWSDAITRLKGAVILQMTMPGAPTIYYGDEVGLVGPVSYDAANSTWQDDPYNRQPFPWLDQSGTPFYSHLQSQPEQDALRSYYTLLTDARNEIPALRTGTFDPLLVDDEGNVYAYGRRNAGPGEDAAIVVINRATVDQEVLVDVRGYLPYGAVLADVLHAPDTYTVNASGMLTIPSVPAMSGVVLSLESGDLTLPDEITDLTVVAERSGEVDLGWTPSMGGMRYELFRSIVSGGGYQFVAEINGSSYTDTGLTNGQTYYYVVVAREFATGLVSGYSNEVAAIPHDLIGWANLQWPPTINHTIGITPTENIYGQVWIDGVTSLPGATPNLIAQVGYGAAGSDPITWTLWVDAEFNAQVGSNDEFKAQLLPEATGLFWYVYRYSTTAGRDWYYADLTGPISPDAPSDPGDLTVNPSADTTPPSAPLNLAVTDWSSDYITTVWEQSSDDAAVYAYDIYRSTTSGETGSVIGRVFEPVTTYTDNSVVSGLTYFYTVQALDTSFNRSALSNQAEGTAEPKVVEVTFRVGVPDYTPGTVFIAGDLPALPTWDPGATPMTKVADNPDIWEITLTLPDGLAGQYKYTRGSWDTVESWGSITGLENRHVDIVYGQFGTQLVDDTATDWGTGADDHKAVRYWRDPIVTGFSPADGAVDVPLETSIDVTWSLSMTASTVFAVVGPTGAVPGSFAYDDLSWTVTFTPAAPLMAGSAYTVTVSGQVSANGGGQQVPVSFGFTTIPPAAVNAPQSVTLSGLTSGVPDVIYTFLAETEPLTSTTPLTYVWYLNELEIASHTGALTDTLELAFETAGTYNLLVRVSNSAGFVTAELQIEISVPQFILYLPPMMYESLP